METNEIRTLLEKADKAEDKAGSKYRWNAAKAISEALVGGKSARSLAKEIGKSRQLVDFYKRVWNERNVATWVATQSFQEAYRAVQNRPTPTPHTDRAAESFKGTEAFQILEERKNAKKAPPGTLALIGVIQNAKKVLASFQTCEGREFDHDAISLLLEEFDSLVMVVDYYKTLLSGTTDIDSALAEMLNGEGN